MVLAVDSSGQTELADEVLCVRASESGVKYAAAVRHGFFQCAVIVMDIAADAVADDVALYIQRLPANRRQAAHIAINGFTGKIGSKADLPVFGIAVDDVAAVSDRAAARQSDNGRRLQDVKMAVVIAVRTVAAEGGVGEVTVEQRRAAICLRAEGTVAAVEGITAVAVNRSDAAAADAAFREIAHHAVAIGTRGGCRKAIQMAPALALLRRAAIVADIAGRQESPSSVLPAAILIATAVVAVVMLSFVIGVDGEAGAVDRHGDIVATAGCKQQGRGKCT